MNKNDILRAYSESRAKASGGAYNPDQFDEECASIAAQYDENHLRRAVVMIAIINRKKHKRVK